MDPSFELAQEIHDLFGRFPGDTLATAESCTGGGVARAITSVAGSSDYFDGGAVAYSNAVKKELLGVPDEVFASVGAVSEECARAMAEGALAAFHADYALATTGIAGPGGATRTKPVGLVYISMASDSGTEVRRLQIDGDRETVMNEATRSALEMLRDALASRPTT